MLTAATVRDALEAACGQVRPAGPDDAVAGVQPSFVAAPASVDEASAVMRAAAALGLAVLPRGGGTKVGWGAAPGRCDLIVETRLMNAVIEHAAGDLVARVQAGVPAERLSAVLGAAGQRLALDPPALGGGQTIGGLLATGVAGPLRLRYGTPRDLLIGITVVRADGAVTRSGGKVVKNVAGYDLCKLYAGSYGTLGLIAEAAFRLHPLPAATAFVTLECADPAAAQSLLAAAVGSPLAPVAAELDRPAATAPVRAGILLEGDRDGVAARAERMRRIVGAGAASSPEPPPWWGRGAAASAGGTVIRIAFWAGELVRVLAATDAAAAAAGLDPAVSGSAAGIIHVAADAGAEPAAVARFVAALRAGLTRGGAARGGTSGDSASGAGGSGTGVPAAADGGLHVRASAVVLHAPAEVRAAIDMWGPVQSPGLMRSVKDQFDPEHRMAPGRFAGGI
jgi:glycolate oxidase FAD binding subunit